MWQLVLIKNTFIRVSSFFMSQDYKVRPHLGGMYSVQLSRSQRNANTSLGEVQAQTEAELTATLTSLEGGADFFVAFEYACFTLYLKGGLCALPFIQEVAKAEVIIVRSALVL